MNNENLAYYLKYRPQSLDQLIGQEQVKKTLLSAFLNNKLSHAYLFVGPRGTGKTSTARILAKMVNCEKEDPPCNKCSTCLSITDGSNLDLIEIDAASNRGIEDIRSLREKIKLSPTRSKKKVYIIDEVHMLTTDAFNALLKTLEEPPSHALFILATTEVARIPQTIMSRVQRLDFKLATQSELMEALQKITKLEKINIDESALKFLTKRSDGSFRDGVKLLDQVASMEGKITSIVLEKFLKASNFEMLLSLIEVLGKKDTKQGLTLISKEMKEGVDIKELIISLMDLLRNIVFIKNGLGEELVKENYSEENYESLTKISENFTNGDLVKSLDLLQKALEKMKTSSIPSLPLELAIVEICGLESQIELVSKKEELIVSEIPTNRPTETHIPSELSEGELRSSEGELRSSEGELRSSDTPNSDIQKLKEKWTFVLETIRPYNFSLEALLRSISITECTDTEVFIEVPYSFHQRILEAPKNRDILESILSEILGRNIKVSTILGNRPPRREDVANIELAADDDIIRAAAEIFNSDTVN